ncbi:DEAD/DEAH box helicase [Thiofilum flexile]|uniref:DEAD/DEAH box helicase n=1 Tax=Thiofilum flexile TaxID=125627 RepID=UPI000373687E|nr:DEAD/DEAH box helicase [Thiofilum flexile]
MELIVKRHCVTALANGLSPLQQRLLDEPKRVRIADAPTGAGKTYAFIKALLQGSRILFIVPTRRLAQNIAATVINNLIKAGWSSTLAEQKLAVWSSDQTAVLQEQGVTHIRGLRVRQMQRLSPRLQGESEMIVAVPEVVNQLLLRGRPDAPQTGLDKGQAGFSVFDLLEYFDHIVFDEFHTIEARGFGLAALLAKLVSVTTESGHTGYGRAKISLLSATPLNIKPTLTALGVPEGEIAELKEVLTEGQNDRALHGDVRLVLHEQSTMPALVGAYLEPIQYAVAQDQQVVLIYNALADLRRDLPALIQQFKALGIPANKVLVINSIDDSAQHHQARAGYYTGRQQDPDQFAILIATASVEIGVTFRAANLMLMESGFAPMNFLQRYGRAARKGADGLVVVRLDNALCERQPWLRALKEWVSAHENTKVSILELSQVLSHEAQQQFQGEPVNTNTLYFGALPQQAVYTSGLYWQLLIRHPSAAKHRKQHLLQHQPDSSKWVYSKLSQLEPLLQDRRYAKPAQQWRTLLFMQAAQYRDIGKRVAVLEGDGRRLQVDRVWLERETDIMRLCPPRYDEREQEYFQLQGELDDYLLDDKNRATRRLNVYFPHTKYPKFLEYNSALWSEWRKHLNNQRDIDTEMAWDDYPDAMKAAEQLVALTGLTPSTDTEVSTSTMNLVW